MRNDFSVSLYNTREEITERIELLKSYNNAAYNRSIHDLKQKLNDLDLIKKLQDNDYFLIIQVPGRGYCGLTRMMYTTGLCVNLKSHGYYGRYCYETFFEAAKALVNWDGTGDPDDNWIKYKGGDGERANPNK